MNENKQELEVTIYLRGDDLDPAQASQLLELEPSKSQRKNEERITSTNRKVITKTGLWALTAKSKSEDLSVLIDELNSKIGSRAPVLFEIPGVQEMYLDIFVAVDADSEDGGTCEFQLSAESLRSLKNLGLVTRFTVAFVRN